MARRVEIRCTPTMLEEMVAQPPAAEEATETELAREDMARSLLMQLSVKQREALELRMAGYSYTQAADTLQISVRSVRVRVERGLEKLHRLVEDSPTQYFLP
jgi:RNA polymerase sigma factor (sigma-70 family)